MGDSPLLDIVFIVAGLTVFFASRAIADGFSVLADKDPNRSEWVNWLGMRDDYASRLHRWAICVLLGVVFVAIGVVGLIT